MKTVWWGIRHVGALLPARSRKKLVCNPNTALRRVQTRVRLTAESQTTTYDSGEQWWTSAGSDAPSLTAQLPLLDGAEGESNDTGNIDKIRALSPGLPGKDARDSLGLHEETPAAPPLASTRDCGGGSRLHVLINVGAVTHVSTSEAQTPLRLRPAVSSAARPFLGRRLCQQQRRRMTLTPDTSGYNLTGSSRLDWTPPAHA
jgi:hypothetical protein